MDKSKVIQSLSPEERVLTSWCNQRLAHFGIKISRILGGTLNDGLILLKLWEALEGKIPPHTSKSSHHGHKHLQIALQLFSDVGVDISLTAEDIEKGDEKKIFDLLFLIIVHYHIGGSSDIRSCQRKILHWLQENGISVVSTQSFFANAKNLVNLINTLKASTIPEPKLSGKSNAQILEIAFNAAQETLGIASLLDPNDSKYIDSKIITVIYLSYFYKQFPPKNPGTPPPVNRKSNRPLLRTPNQTNIRSQISRSQTGISKQTITKNPSQKLKGNGPPIQKEKDFDPVFHNQSKVVLRGPNVIEGGIGKPCVVSVNYDGDPNQLTVIAKDNLPQNTVTSQLIPRNNEYFDVVFYPRASGTVILEFFIEKIFTVNGSPICVNVVLIPPTLNFIGTLKRMCFSKNSKVMFLMEVLGVYPEQIFVNTRAGNINIPTELKNIGGNNFLSFKPERSDCYVVEFFYSNIPIRRSEQIEIQVIDGPCFVSSANFPSSLEVQEQSYATVRFEICGKLPDGVGAKVWDNTGKEVEDCSTNIVDDNIEVMFKPPKPGQFLIELTSGQMGIEMEPLIVNLKFSDTRRIRAKSEGQRGGEIQKKPSKSLELKENQQQNKSIEKIAIPAPIAEKQKTKDKLSLSAAQLTTQPLPPPTVPQNTSTEKLRKASIPLITRTSEQHFKPSKAPIYDYNIKQFENSDFLELGVSSGDLGKIATDPLAISVPIELFYRNPLEVENVVLSVLHPSGIQIPTKISNNGSGNFIDFTANSEGIYICSISSLDGLLQLHIPVSIGNIVINNVELPTPHITRIYLQSTNNRPLTENLRTKVYFVHNEVPNQLILEEKYYLEFETYFSGIYSIQIIEAEKVITEFSAQVFSFPDGRVLGEILSSPWSNVVAPMHCDVLPSKIKRLEVEDEVEVIPSTNYKQVEEVEVAQSPKDKLIEKEEVILSPKNEEPSDPSLIPSPKSPKSPKKEVTGYKQFDIPMIPSLAGIKNEDLQIVLSNNKKYSLKGRILHKEGKSIIAQFLPLEMGTYEVNCKLLGQTVGTPFTITVVEDEIMRFYVGQLNTVPVADIVLDNGNVIGEDNTDLAVILLGPENTKIARKLSGDAPQIKFTPMKIGNYRVQIFDYITKDGVFPTWEISVVPSEITQHDPEVKHLTVGKNGRLLELQPLKAKLGGKLKYGVDDIIMKMTGPVDVTSSVSLSKELAITAHVSPKKPGLYAVQLYYYKQPILTQDIYVEYEDTNEKLIASILKARSSFPPTDLIPPSKEYIAFIQNVTTWIETLETNNWSEILLEHSSEEIHDLFIDIMERISQVVINLNSNSANMRYEVKEKVDAEMVVLHRLRSSLANIAVSLLQKNKSDRITLVPQMKKLCSALSITFRTLNGIVSSPNSHSNPNFGPSVPSPKKPANLTIDNTEITKKSARDTHSHSSHEETHTNPNPNTILCPLTGIDLSKQDSKQIINQVILFLNDKKGKDLPNETICDKYKIPTTPEVAINLWFEIVKFVIAELKNPDWQREVVITESVRCILYLDNIVLGQFLQKNEDVVRQFTFILMKIVSEKILTNAITENSWIELAKKIQYAKQILTLKS